MRLRKRFLVLLGAVVVFALLVKPDWHGGEPSYEGRSLSVWLEEYGDNRYGNGDKRQYSTALRHMGTNAIPYLMRWIRYDRPGWHCTLARFEYRVRELLRKPMQGNGLLEFNHQEIRAASAARAFWMLGPQAEGAVPELRRLKNDPKAGDGAERAAEVLEHLANLRLNSSLPEGWTNEIASIRYHWAQCIGVFNSETRPIFLKMLNDPDWAIRDLATNRLRLMDFRPTDR